MPPSSSSAAAASLALSAPVLTVSIWELVAIAFTCSISFAAEPASDATRSSVEDSRRPCEKTRGVISHPRARLSGLLAAPLAFQFSASRWQGQRESNPQPSVLETDALPIELYPCSFLQKVQAVLLDDLGDDAGADGTAAFTDGEAQAFFHRDRGDQLDRDRHVVAWHDHFLAFRQFDGARHVRRAEVELGTIVVEERRVAAAFVLGQHVDLAREVRVRLDRVRLAQNLATLDVFTLGAAQQDTDVVAGLTLVEQLAEHFHARARRLLRHRDADDLDFFADLDDAALDTTGHDRAATRDREHVFNRHQEGAVHRALRRRDVRIQCVGQLHDGLFAQLARVAFEGQLRRA